MYVNKRISLAESIIEENVKNCYLNEFVDESNYRKISKDDKVLAVAEYALNEYVNTTKIIDAVFNNKDKSDTVFTKVENDLKNNAYFKDIERSAGDITKTKHHKDIKALLVHIQTSKHDKLSGEYTVVLQVAIICLS